MATARHPKATYFVQRHLFSGLTSFAELEHKIAALPEEKTRGDAFEQFVKAFLLLESEYASKLKSVWLYNEVPAAIAKKLKLPSTDQGIDIVAETCDGEFWAVQCKYRQITDQSLTWREISTFTGLAFGVCRGFAFGLICSTTERITNVLKNQERIGFCALDAWQELDADFWIHLQAHFAHKQKSLLPSKPRPHQRAAIKDGHQHFTINKAKRGKLIMPCGSGKSLTAYWIAEKLNARRIVIAVPSLALIRQTLKVWLRETMANRQAVEWICVCSDESAGRIERDDVTVLRQDLGVPCLTDPVETSAWLKRQHHGLTVVFTTYQSGEALANAVRSARFHFDLGIMDEAHKTVGDGGKLFSHLLHDKNLSIRQRIFMTATERRYAGQSDTVLSMDDPAIYGETFHLLSFKRAMEYDPPILCDYKIISIAVSRDEVAELIRKNIFVKPDKGRWNQEIEADMLASLVALRKAMTKYPIHHAVSFHGSIQRAELFKAHNDAFSHAYPKYGSLETFHVSGKTPTGTRARVIGEFAETKRALITNARCLTEGVDVPGIDCVLFADPRRSAVDIVQAVGRALRPAPGKKLGYVIVPILHDADATPDDIFESESFQEILTTLRALAANDDRIIEYFRAISQGRQSTGGGSVEFDMDERLAQRIDLAQFVREIDLKCWNRLAKLSWRPFEEARDFVRSLRLKRQFSWSAFCRGEISQLGQRPADIPTNPQRAYADDGWKSWGDWLGNGAIAARFRIFRPFREARAYTHKLKLNNFTEWRVFCRGDMPKLGLLPTDIPSVPWNTYNDKGWKNLGDWLGTGNISYHLKKHRSFHQARIFAHTLGLKSSAEWRSFCKGEMSRLGKLPTDIPTTPNTVYADKGWKGMGDWLGTGRIADQYKRYLSFKKARAFVRRLHLKTSNEWYEYCPSGKKPQSIPASPENTYKDSGWIGIRDWLGTRPGFVGYLPFEEARQYVHTLKLPTQAKWVEFCKSGNKPNDIPTAPQSTYKKHWKSSADWLGHGRLSSKEIRAQFWPFEEARRFVRKLNLKNYAEWIRYLRSSKRPLFIPSSPKMVYGAAYISLPDWLGTKIGFKGFLKYAEAEKFARALKLQSKSQWDRFIKSGKLPANIPRSPGMTYKGNGWKSWGDWLGTGRVADQLKQFRPFREARAFVHKLKLKNTSEWNLFCKGDLPNLGRLPADITTVPRNTYAGKGWKGFGDWLGTGRVADQLKQFRSFRDAQAFVHKLKLKSQSEWTRYCKGDLPNLKRLPADIPKAPQYVYAQKGWKGTSDWLGTGRTRQTRRKQK